MMTEPTCSEGRLLRGFKLRRLNAAISVQMAELARELEDELLAPLVAAGGTAAGDPGRLRGIPAIGRGVGGALAHTRPGDDASRVQAAATSLGVRLRRR